MLKEGRIALTDLEIDAIDMLISKYPNETVSFTRCDPNEEGPILLHVGEESYQIDEDGTCKKVTT